MYLADPAFGGFDRSQAERRRQAGRAGGLVVHRSGGRRSADHRPVARERGVLAGREKHVAEPGVVLDQSLLVLADIGVVVSQRLGDVQGPLKGLKLAGRAAVYTHRDVQKVLAQLSAAKIDRLSAVPVYEFDRSFVDEIAGLIERRSTLSISVTERELYLEIRGRTFIATIVEHRAE